MRWAEYSPRGGVAAVVLLLFTVACTAEGEAPARPHGVRAPGGDEPGVIEPRICRRGGRLARVCLEMKSLAELRLEEPTLEFTPRVAPARILVTPAGKLRYAVTVRATGPAAFNIAGDYEWEFEVEGWNQLPAKGRRHVRFTGSEREARYLADIRIRDSEPGVLIDASLTTVRSIRELRRGR